MSKNTASGTCLLCRGTFSSGGMSQHLGACLKKHPPEGADPNRRARVFHLCIEGQYLRDYWLHLEARASAKLGDLDQFLRHIWVECCDHLSAFEINGRQYLCHPMAELGQKDMGVALGDVFTSKTTFTYQYDFGSTTHLAGRVISDTNAPYRSEPLRLLARNCPPEIPCGYCDEPAELLCSFCSCESEGWFCRACMPKHDCPEADPNLFHPIANSPRVGVCGYTG